MTESGWGRSEGWGKTSKKRQPPKMDPLAGRGVRRIESHRSFSSYLSIICPYPILLSFFLFSL